MCKEFLSANNSKSVVVLDSKDHSVLAMYSAPNYDLNMFNPFITYANWDKLVNELN